MANEIPGIVRAQVLTPTPESGQFAKLGVVGESKVKGQSLPANGKDLPQQAVSDTQLKEAVSRINDYVQSIERDLSFSQDEATGRTVIRVVDSGSGELVRQIPSEEVLALASVLQDVGNASNGVENIPTGILFSKTT